ncbi:MAG: phosphoenolpyruvate synthase regulatory protein [Candidatus Cloacimonadota bacterium]|nr:MAG: phosphoenolpyruvate synthase regulatory protein [Candidatus Cloacimonadota bacterium]PIE78633.1 MAG: phosphoenolpyruvate synthase regulatory protein [Candidatus Delongbacteria bacterium]
MVKRKKSYKIYVISDTSCLSAERVAKATAVQFLDWDYEIINNPFISKESEVVNIINKASKSLSIVVFTTVIKEIKDCIIENCNKHNIEYLDIMSRFLYSFKGVLKTDPAKLPGITRSMDDSYFKMVEAVEFAIKYDDGKLPEGILLADYVLIGISRTSKTPLSMFLAHQSYKMVNIPIVLGVDPPKELFEIDKRRVIGLIINPRKLNSIRHERIKVMGDKPSSSYIDMEQILKELEFSEKIMKKIGCPVIDVTNKAIEESANIINKIIKRQEKYRKRFQN